MEAVARDQGITFFTLACAITTAALARHSGKTDIVFGTQIAGRHDQDLEHLIGVFINNLVFRIDASGDPTFSDLLTRTNTTVQDGLVHQNMPFHRLVNILNPPRDPSRTPLISVSFTVMAKGVRQAEFGKFALITHPSESAGSVYDLNIFMVPWPSGWRISMEYNPDLFERATIEGIFLLWQSIMERAVDSLGFRLSDLAGPITSKAHRPPNVTHSAVEAALRSHPNVAEVTLSNEAGHGAALRASIVPATNTLSPLESLPRLLEQHLASVAPGVLTAERINIFLKLPNGSYGGAASSESAFAAAPKGPATREVEAKLAAIWRDLLEVKIVEPDSNFFAIGGHSLLALRLMLRIESAFGVKLHVTSLFEAPTLRELASLLQTDEPSVENWNIVKIQGEGSKIPVIAINNTVADYNLARRVGTDRPFIGIQLFDPSAPKPLEHRDLEDVAADYVRLIRKARPQGPYVLMGLCVAGAIAYEVATQLRRDGEDVPLVVLSDTWRPGYLRGLPFFRKQLASWHYRLHVARHYIGEVSEGRASLTEVLSRYRLVRQSRILNLVHALHLIDEVPQNREDWGNRWFLPYLEAARNRYRPPTSKGTLVLYQSDEIVTRLSDKLMGWSEFADRIEVQKAPGWHTSMFQDEGAAVIADHLRPLLEQVDLDHARSA